MLSLVALVVTVAPMGLARWRGSTHSVTRPGSTSRWSGGRLSRLASRSPVGAARIRQATLGQKAIDVAAPLLFGGPVTAAMAGGRCGVGGG